MLRKQKDSLQLEFDFIGALITPMKLSCVKANPLLPTPMGKDYAYNPLFNRYGLLDYSGYADTLLSEIPEVHANAILKILYAYKGYNAKPNLHRIYVDYLATGWVPGITLRTYLARIGYKVKCIQTDEFRTALVRENPMSRALTFQQRDVLKRARMRHLSPEAWDDLMNSANKSAEDIRALALSTQDLATNPFIGEMDIATKSFHGSTEFYIGELRAALNSKLEHGYITQNQHTAFLAILDQFLKDGLHIDRGEVAKKLGVTSARVSQLFNKLQSVLKTLDMPTENNSTI